MNLPALNFVRLSFPSKYRQSIEWTRDMAKQLLNAAPRFGCFVPLLGGGKSRNDHPVTEYLQSFLGLPIINAPSCRERFAAVAQRIERTRCPSRLIPRGGFGLRGIGSQLGGLLNPV